MAVISIKETSEARNGSWSYDGNRSYKRHWVVKTNRRDDGQATVLASMGLLPGDSYVNRDLSEFDTFAILKTLSAQCREAGEGAKLWDVTADYGTVKLEQPAENPLARPVEISGGFNRTEEIVDEDINDVAVLNSAGDPFDPAVTRDNSLAVLSFTRNEASAPVALSFALKDKVNSSPWQGAATGTVKSIPLKWTKKFENDVTYYEVGYDFEHDPNGWQARVLDQGLRFLNDDGTRENIKDANGDDVTAPVPLDGTGYALPPDGTAVFLDFDRYEEYDFNSLDLPTA